MSKPIKTTTQTTVDYTVPVRLKKPAKHGDQITFEDYTENMSTIEKYLNVYMNSGLVLFGKQQSAVDFKKDFIKWAMLRIDISKDDLAKIKNKHWTPDMTTLVTKKNMDDAIKNAVASVHNHVGSITVSDGNDAIAKIQAFDAGQALTLNSGKTYCAKSTSNSCDIHANVDDTITFSPNGNSGFLAETLGVSVDPISKNLILVPYSSNNNTNDYLEELDGRVTINEDIIQTLENNQFGTASQVSVNIEDIKDNKTAAAANHGAINSGMMQYNDLKHDFERELLDFAFLKSDVAKNTQGVYNDDGRITALEKSAAASNNLWLPTPPATGMIFPGTGDKRTMDMSAMVGTEGVFSFKEGQDAFMITIRNKTNGDTDTEYVVVSKAGTTDHSNGFSLKKSSDDIDFSIDANGLATLHKTAGTIHLDDVEFIRAFQSKKGLVSNSVTQATFAAEKVLMAGEVAKKVDISDYLAFKTANAASIATKQDKNAPHLATNSKDIVTAINEEVVRVNTVNTRVDDLNTRKVDNKNTNLDSMDGTTDAKTLSSKAYVDTKDALKQDKLTKTIKLKFDDGSTEDIKVG